MIRFSLVIAPTIAALVVVVLEAPGRAESVSADALLKANNNCLTSVAKVVGLPRASLKVIGHTSNASGISVDVKVPKATAPWGCHTDRHGTVKDVHFKGSEGAL